MKQHHFFFLFCCTVFIKIKKTTTTFYSFILLWQSVAPDLGFPGGRMLDEERCEMQRKIHKVGGVGSRGRYQSSKEHFDTPASPPGDTCEAAKICCPDKSADLKSVRICLHFFFFFNYFFFNKVLHIIGSHPAIVFI